MLRESFLFCFSIIGCLVFGWLHSTKGSFELSNDDWMLVVIRTCTIQVMYYLTLLLLCILRVTRKYNVTLALKLILLLSFCYITYSFRIESLIRFLSVNRLVMTCSLVWLFMQGLHVYDNAQIFHNYLLFHILRIKVNQVAERNNALTWLYSHLGLSFTLIVSMIWICTVMGRVIDSNADYCLDRNYVTAIFPTTVIFNAVFVLLSLPRFTNKGLLLPLCLCMYQLYLTSIIVLLKIHSCTFAGSVEEAAVRDRHTLEVCVVVWSSFYFLMIVAYNLTTPNLKTLYNIMRGHLCNHYITDQSEVVLQSWLFADSEYVRHYPQTDENMSLLGNPNPSAGTVPAGYGALRQHSPYVLHGEEVGRKEVISAEDKKASPIPLYYVYFLLLSLYLPMYLSNWAGVTVFIRPEKDNTNPKYFYAVDYVSYSIISIQILLWLIYGISLFNAYVARM